MSGQIFYSDNDSNTFADILKAVGLAEVFGAWLEALGRDQAPIVIEEQGTHFQLQLSSPLDRTAIQNVEQPFLAGGARLLNTKNIDVKTIPSALRLEGFPYEEMQANRERYFERLKQLGPAERTHYFKHPEAEEFAELRKLMPHPDLRFYAYINHMKVAGGYNRLFQQWYGDDLDAFRLNLAFVLEGFAEAPNTVYTAAQAWDKAMRQHGAPYQRDTTRWQLSNPTSGKGEHAAKANTLAIRNLQGFWLLEYLKLVGLFTVGMSVMVAGSKDRKTYILHPGRAEHTALKELMQGFRQNFSATTAIKLDILAVLRFTRILVEYQQRVQSLKQAPPPTSPERPEQLADLARGFEVAFYKDMGSAHAIMDLATLNPPPWLRTIKDAQDASSILLVLDEHHAVIQSIQDDRGAEGAEEGALLSTYRAFLSGGEIRSFFDFAASYGEYVLAKLRRTAWAKLLTTAGLESLMALMQGNQKLAPILENEGFRAVAGAIRRSTIIAQFLKARHAGYPYEVRYGLGQEIRRTATNPEDFAGALSDFLMAYNTENIRVRQRINQGSLPNRPEYRRRFLKNEHLNQIVKLVDDYGSEVVCKLLVASGYLLDSTRSDQQRGTDEEVDDAPPGEDLDA